MRTNNETPTINDPYFEEIKTKTSISFDFVLWFYRILKYWYLFAISIVICIIFANLGTKGWIPYYRLGAIMMLEDRGNVSPVAGAVPLGTILRNTNNQKIVLESRGMVEKTVGRLPERMRVNYFRKTHFKQSGIYGYSPVVVDIIELKPEAYGRVYTVASVDDSHCQVYYEGADESLSFSIVVPYDKIVDTEWFKVKFVKSDNYEKDFYKFSFNFLTREQLINSYAGRVGCNLIHNESTAFSLTMTTSEVNKDLEFMNEFLAEYQDYNLSLKNYQADLTIDFIDMQLQIIGDSLETSRAALDNFQRNTGVYEVTSQALRRQIREADKERENQDIKERSILVVTDRILTSLKANEEIIDPSMYGISEARLSRYVRDYNEMLKRSEYIGVKNPTFEKVVSELNDLRELILAELRLIQSNFVKEKEKAKILYAELEVAIDSLPPQERILVKHQREYNLNEVYLNFLTQRRYEAQIQRASNTPDNFILENPRMTSGVINSGSASKEYTYYLLLGCLIPLIFVVLKEEILNFTVSTKEECERISGFPVIGTIENVAKKISKGVTLVKNYPKSSFAESFRNMRVRIEYMAKKDSHVAVLVTSTEPADGKTFVATNVASVYQLMGKKVVLLDLDLRRPSVSKTLKLPTTAKGVSNYLIGQVELDQIIMSHPTYGFDIIPAGTLPPNPSELIKTEKTKKLIEHLREQYDYVIIDCSPIGLVSDAYILAKIVDTSLFVIRRAKTNKAFFKSVIGQVKYDGVQNIALVFNDVKGREGYYGTSRYYGDKTYYLKKKSSYYHDDYFED